MTETTRRDFISTAGKTVGGVVVAGSIFGRAATVAAQDRQKLGVALVGLGSLSTNQIAPALMKTGHCELTAIVTGTPAKEAEWAERYNIPAANIYNYDNFDSIADNDAVDLIYIVLPNSMHHEFTLRGARAGKHVFCEKPMANTSAECEEMIRVCEDSNVRLAIAYRCQFDPYHLECMRMVRDRDFGEVKMIEAGFGFRIGNPDQWRLKKDLAGGGAMMDVGVYAVQASRYLSGEEPIEVMATESKTDPVKFAEVDETIHWHMKFPSGIVSNCTTTYNANGVNNFTVFAERGNFGMDPAFSYVGNQGFAGRDALEFPPVDQFALEMDDFAQCIKEGRESKVAGIEGLRDLRVIEAIYESIATGRKVSL